MAVVESLIGLPKAGDRIASRYELVRKISEGAGGIVWEAVDPERGAVALKFLKWSPLKSRKVAAERFKNEFSILKSLSHPNISEIYDFGLDSESDLYFFTTELLTEGDLKLIVGSSIEGIEELLLQALRSLEYLRGNKLLHLDIKPQNLLLREGDDGPVLVMIDFGLATFRPPDKPGGTANYIPPEIVVRRLADEYALLSYPNPDHRSDLYSLGVTFYYCLTGVQPFCAFGSDGKRVDAMATLKKHVEHEPPPPSSIRKEIPSYLDSIIMKLMAQHPADRYPSAAVAAQALQYRSPIKHAPESTQTLLSYLPKEGKIIGRHDEIALVEDALTAIAENKLHSKSIFCVTGGRGTGRTRFLNAITPIAQKMELNVAVVDLGGSIEDALSNFRDASGSKKNNRPIVLLVDNAENYMKLGADAELRALIRRLRTQQKLTDVASSKVFLVLSINTEKIDLQQALMDMRLDDSACLLIQLKKFTSPEIVEYLTTLLGETPDAAVVDQLEHCTEGNPLFITEHLEQMIAEGRLFSLAGRPDAKTLKAIGVDFSKSIPSRSMAEAITDRLNQLPDDVGELARLLACWNRPTSRDELSATYEKDSVSQGLLGLVSAGLIRRGGVDGRFAFLNSLAANIIVDGMDPSKLAGYHDSIASYLESAGADTANIDEHVAFGSDEKKRISALDRVAVRSRENDEHLATARFLEELLKLSSNDDLLGRAKLLERLGEAYERGGNIKSARDRYHKLYDLNLNEYRVLASEHLGLLSMRSRKSNEARKYFENAADGVSDSNLNGAKSLRIRNYLATLDLHDGRVEDAVCTFKETAVLENKLIDEERMSVDNNELGAALIRYGKPEEGIEILSKELLDARKLGDVKRVVERHYHIGNALRNSDRGRDDEALGHYHKGLKLAREHRMIKMQVRFLNGLGNLRLKMGNPTEALCQFREGFNLAQQMDSDTTSVELMIGMGLSTQSAGDPDGTIEYLEAALDFASGPKGNAAGLIRRYLPTIHISLADALCQIDELDRSESNLKRAHELDGECSLTPDIRYSLYGTFVELYIKRGDVEMANHYMPELETSLEAFPEAKNHFEELKERMLQFT